jgi:hypothetical protein
MARSGFPGQWLANRGQDWHGSSRRGASPWWVTSCYERSTTTRCAVLNAVATGTGLEHSAALRLRRLEHPRHGQGWGGSEETQLLAAFRDGRSIKELSAEHQRSRWRSGDGC